MVTFNKKITLMKCPSPNGRGPRTVEARYTTRCHLDKPGFNLMVGSEQAGWQIDLTAELWQRDYERDSFTHADVNGTMYRIKKTLPGKQQLTVRLLLSRG